MKNTIEKIIAMILLISFCMPLGLVAESPLPEQIDFGGFDFSGGNSTISLEEQTAKEVATIIQNKGSKEDPYVLVGHSQGGLRALAAVKMLEEKSITNEQARRAYNNLKGVITISGANRGFQGLEGGFGPLSSRLWADVRIILNGLVAGIGLADDLSLGSLFFTGMNLEGATKLVLSFFPEDFHYILNIVAGKNVDAFPELRDMMPRSEFIEKYVAKTQKDDFKVQVGTTYRLEWRYNTFWGIRWYYLVSVAHPVYKYYSEYTSVPVAKDTLPVAYIVGENDNTLGMFGEKNEKIARDVLTGLGAGFTAVSTVHLIKSFTLPGLISGSPVHSYNAGRAAIWCFTVDKEINELFGKSNGDGFISQTNQQYPRVIRDPKNNKVLYEYKNPLIVGGTTTAVGYNYNHKNIMPPIVGGNNSEIQWLVNVYTQTALDYAETTTWQTE